MPDIIVGKNAIDNWKILDEANIYDTWFHLDKFSSAYVIVNQYIDDMDKETIYKAANLCKEKSKYKNMRNVSIIYTFVKNLKKGSEIGEVIIKSRKKCKKIII